MLPLAWHVLPSVVILALEPFHPPLLREQKAPVKLYIFTHPFDYVFRTCVLTNTSLFESNWKKNGFETSSENLDSMVAVAIILTSILVSVLKWPCDLDGKRHLCKKPAYAATDSSAACAVFSYFRAFRPPTETPFPSKKLGRLSGHLRSRCDWHDLYLMNARLLSSSNY